MPEKTSFKLNKKIIALLVVIVLAVCSVGTTVAYIIALSENSIENVFTPGKIEVSVNQSTLTNSSVKVEIDGTLHEVSFTVFARAKESVHWKHTENNGYSVIPPTAEVDYTITYNTAEGWFLGTDGFWYYKYALDPEQSTPPLLTVSNVQNAPSGYGLCVDILWEVVQATPDEGVETSWPAVTVTEEGGSKVIVSAAGG